MRKHYWLGQLSMTHDREAAVGWAVRLGRQLLQDDHPVTVQVDGCPHNAQALLRDAEQSSDARTILLLFAEFEAAIREVYRHHYRKTTAPDAYPLMESIANRVLMAPDVLEAAHRARQARNDIIHSAASSPIDSLGARSSLARFLSWLPDWTIST